jgi:hypothetical protein
MEINDRINNEQMLHEIEESLKAASADPDSADRCQKRLIRFQEAIDEMEYVIKGYGNSLVETNLENQYDSHDSPLAFISYYPGKNSKDKIVANAVCN